MHYGNLVIIEKPADGVSIEKAVGAVMEKYRDHWWDWYQIGGRWTGALDGYDPEKDPQNADPDRVGAAKWPTEWAKHPGDIAPIESVTEEAYSNRFFRVVTDYKCFGGEYYQPWKSGKDDCFLKLDRPPLEWLKAEYAGQLAVVVDNHD